MTVLAQINDLGLLKALLPLKLTDDQRAKLLDILRQVAQQAKSRARQDEAALRALAADVAKARAEALAGTDVPAELEERVAAARKAAEDRQKRARADAIGRILAVAKATLTPEQRERISAQSVKALGGRLVPREFRNNPDKAPREAVLDLATASFIEWVLLNERAIEVLSQMTASAGTTVTPPAAQ